MNGIPDAYGDERLPLRRVSAVLRDTRGCGAQSDGAAEAVEMENELVLGSPNAQGPRPVADAPGRLLRSQHWYHIGVPGPQEFP